ncbi:hypothetical protein EG68_11029 [Paragonimus skrjabini miyazakii]|uniref:Uncharacterized protein n=1 Tax=Paragonimus skrjabini miyazakii TaxID=59628 RepID=A0A8S9YJZ6_9TREM|nr:hypothetical protein EG68_11029 [Paragonimus skrjabini miyazakii]
MEIKLGDVEDLESRPSAVTLYKAIEEKGKFMGRTSILYSVMMVGKISPHVVSHDEVASYFEGMLMQFKPPDHITGLLMIYPYHVVNIIETSFRTMMRIFRSLNESERIIQCYIEQYTEMLNKDLAEDDERRQFTGFDQATLDEIAEMSRLAPLIHNRILSLRDNMTHRIYRTYEVLAFDMEPVSLTQYDNSEPDDKRLLDTLTQLLRLSLFLSKEPMKNQEEYVPEIFKMKLTEILRRLREEHPELVPQQVTVGYFSEVCTYDAIIPIQEYLNFYDLPFEISLQSEITWPLPKKSFFYY